MGNMLMSASKAMGSTPQADASAKKGAATGGPSPAPSPPPEPSGGAAGKPDHEDPIKVIQSIIHESNYLLLAEIDELLERHENKLRVQVKDVLRRHAAGIDLR